MQNAETVLSIIRERGRRGLPLERLYRQLFNRELFLLAYGPTPRTLGVSVFLGSYDSGVPCVS